VRSRVGTLGPGFRALFLGSLVSNAGDGIRLAALPLLASEVTSSPVLVSAVTAAQYLPWLTVAPVGGAWVDRHDRRRTILVTQAWRGLVMLALALVVASGWVEVWQLCAVAFLITAGEILVDPSVVATVPLLVDDDRLDAANGRIASVEIVTNDFAGGPAGATAFGLAPWLPFLLDGASYLLSLLLFRRLPSDAAVPAVGSATLTPWFFVIESETMMNVASRKKMMSMSGMISIRARLPRAPLAACMACSDQAPTSSWGRAGVEGDPPERGECDSSRRTRSSSWAAACSSSCCDSSMRAFK